MNISHFPMVPSKGQIYLIAKGNILVRTKISSSYVDPDTIPNTILTVADFFGLDVRLG